MVVVLSGGSVVGETSFLPAPPGMRDVGGGGGGRGGKVSEKVCLARLVGVEGVYPGFCRLTVCVVKEKLGFSACCAAGESGVELDNRVKDAVKYGAVRVDEEIVGLLFGA
ncbi:hypothetical protein BCR33DRAFT_720159 [Rhizoclosmatium globosum]|uniref:Uncharacterized protein n=1 Tax=Rhizoclosmatium globosum TaxID=329046 RepID=A0A1Y2BZ28_9FUNG|nr:hypothetical protein BCR33DRAFT_720159 [Rhizoclosmatium globosum]|eukprot:ORY39325.1 hypothetical protein BCR33DRAFT_720159 [Rhizoclosmatium globosum]